MSNVTEYFINSKDWFYNEVKREVEIQNPTVDVLKSDTDRILLTFGLELADGRVMILRSENYKEDQSPSNQLSRMVEAFYDILFFESAFEGCIWPWRDHKCLVDKLNNGVNTSLINRKYLEDD